MHDLSDNRFLVRIGKNDLTLNAYLFNRHVAEKRVVPERFYKSVYALLATLSFNVHLSGYKYLAALATMYLASGDYDEDDAIAKITEYYGTETRYVVVGITESINLNTDFISSASNLLNTQLYTRDCKSINDAVEIIGAIYKLYYNFTVDENEFRRGTATVVPISRLINHAKQ